MRLREFLDYLGIVLLVLVLTALFVLFILAGGEDAEHPIDVDELPWEIEL